MIMSRGRMGPQKGEFYLLINLQTKLLLWSIIERIYLYPEIDKPVGIFYLLHIYLNFIFSNYKKYSRRISLEARLNEYYLISLYYLVFVLITSIACLIDKIKF